MKQQHIYIFLSAALLLAACGGKKEASRPIQPEDLTRAQRVLVNNIRFSVSADREIRTTIPAGLCAQLVDNSGTRFIEISQGPCPASGVVNGSQKIFAFNYVNEGDDNFYEMRDKENGARAGSAEAESTADREKRNVFLIGSLCGEDDACFLIQSGGKLTEIYM